MSFRTDPQRTAIARELLAAMLRGACSSNVDPRYVGEFTKGILAAPQMAVHLTDILIAELDKAVEEPLIGDPEREGK